MFIYVILKHCVESVWAVGSPGLKFLWRISCLQHGIMGNVVSASDVTPTNVSVSLKVWLREPMGNVVHVPLGTIKFFWY